MFGSDVGIVEDPATGAAAGPLGAYLVEQGVMGPGLITISQGAEIGRPSTLFVDVEPKPDGWSVHVGGGVAKVAEGAFDLPLCAEPLSPLRGASRGSAPAAGAIATDRPGSAGVLGRCRS